MYVNSLELKCQNSLIISTVVTSIESIINSVDNLSLTQSQYSIIIKWGSRSLQTPSSLMMKGWSSLEYISISCLNSKNRCSSFISSDLTTTRVSGSMSLMSRALARNTSPNTPLPKMHQRLVRKMYRWCYHL